MSLFTIWPKFGFREDPYSQSTLAPDENGNTLLVGREQEIQSLQMAIGSGGAHAAVEGPIGAGKTSLVNVAVYRMTQACLSAQQGELYLPANEPLQPRADADSFVDDLFRTVARTLIKHRDVFKFAGLETPDTSGFERWLTKSQYESWSVEGQVLGVGAGGSYGSEPNTSEGYTRAGFEHDVRDELRRLFPPGTGGIVCTLDNLEILESVGKARATLDELRDRVFNIQGLRWVLCGSRGIVSRARTQRLSGVIHAPTQVGPLDDKSAVEAIRRRIHRFGTKDAQPPVTPAGFEFIYQALHRNLRDSLENAQAFSRWMVEDYLNKGRDLPAPDDRDRLVESWLLEVAESAHEAATGVQPRHWQFFSELAANGGRAGSSEHASYNFQNQQQLVTAVTALVDANLVTRETDPVNGTRTINTITAVGWLVFFYKDEFESLTSR